MAEALPAAVSNLEISDEVNFQMKDLVAPNYKYRQIQQYNGFGSTLPLSGSDTQSVFKLPNCVANLSKSYLSFDVNVPAQGASNYNVFWTDGPAIREITLQTAGGQVLANLRDCHPYNKTARFMTTNMSDYLSRGSVKGGPTIADTQYTENEYCQPAHCAIQAQTTTANIGPDDTAANTSGSAVVNAYFADTTNGAAMRPSGFSALNAGALAYSPLQVSGSDCDYVSPQHYVACSAVGAAANVASVIRCRLDLSFAVGTLLAVNKDLYLNGDLELVIYWRPLSYWGINCTNAAGNPVAFTSGNLSNYYLYIAQDINVRTASEVEAKFKSGIEMYVPYTNCSQINAPAGSNGSYFSMNVPLVPGNGAALKRIITVPINASNNLTTVANNDNVAQHKYTQLQTRMNGKPVSSDFYLNALLNQDWNYIKPLVKNSPAGLSNRVWNISNFWCDNFSSLARDSTEFLEDDCKFNGMMINENMNYQIDYLINSTGALTILSYQTWVRKLRSGPDGFKWSV